jgi:hypothetical protein
VSFVCLLFVCCSFFTVGNNFCFCSIKVLLKFSSRCFPEKYFNILFTWLRVYEVCVCSFSLVSWGGVRQIPLGTSATNWPVVPAADDRSWWLWSSRWNENWQGKHKYSEKTYPSATLSTTNPTRPDLGSNPDRRCGKPATNRLSYGTAFVCVCVCVCVCECTP